MLGFALLDLGAIGAGRMLRFDVAEAFSARLLAAGLCLALCCAGTFASAAPGKSSQREPRRAVSLPTNPTARADRSEERRVEVLQGAVFALLADRHCGDFSLDLSRLSALLKRYGYKPEDLGPNSRVGERLDRFTTEADELFASSPRRACDVAWSLVGQDGEIADLAASRAR